MVILGSLVTTGLIIGFYQKFKEDSYNPITPSTSSLIIDHNCVKLDQIPMELINTVKDTMKIHYAHTSHGGQINTGLFEIMYTDLNYSVEIGYSSLPSEEGSLCIFDGQESESYITPQLYWESSSGIDDTYDVIDHNPSIVISIWCWCCQVTDYPIGNIQAYLDQINAFEQHYLNQGGNITFVYITGNCDEGDYPEGPAAEGYEGERDPAAGYNRFINNQLIRQYCIENNKTLFDFADIECWLYDSNGNPTEYSTYQYNNGNETIIVPKRCWAYSNVSEAAHTSLENCIHKGIAYWWMLARIAGWNGL
ncbi:MAG: hypothetical protein ACFFDH_03890 [Promethearchaeota archaeon]